MDAAIRELKKMNEKTDKLLSRTRKLIQEIDSEAQLVIEHVNRVKQLLGLTETHCCICFKAEPSHCLEPCHHVFCYDCANKCLRNSARKCFVCRQAVTSIKIFNS